MMRLTSSRRPAPSAWKIALCSESTGSTVAPALAAARMNRPPAQTRHSLLASATVAPRSIAASVGFRSDRAADRAHHPIGRPLRRFDQRLVAGGGFDAAAGERALELAIGRRIADHRDARVQFARDLGERGRVAARGDRFDAVARRVALDQVDRAGADRAGGAENGDAAQGGCGFVGGARVHALTIPSRPRAGASKPPRARPIRQATSAAAQNPSSRSMTPPWPGMRWLASLAPNCRLMRDSKRSPSLRRHRQHQRERRDRVEFDVAENVRAGRRHRHGAERADDRARPGFFGLMAGASLRPPKARPPK